MGELKYDTLGLFFANGCPLYLHRRRCVLNQVRLYLCGTEASIVPRSARYQADFSYDMFPISFRFVVIRKVLRKDTRFLIKLTGFSSGDVSIAEMLQNFAVVGVIFTPIRNNSRFDYCSVRAFTIGVTIDPGYS